MLRASHSADRVLLSADRRVPLAPHALMIAEHAENAKISTATAHLLKQQAADLLLRNGLEAECRSISNWKSIFCDPPPSPQGT
jgi:hypothetical protein